jgi:ankyrin repeat protein
VLHVAAMRGNNALCQLLLSAGAALEARDAQDCTPMHRAVEARVPRGRAAAVLTAAGL